MAPTANSLVVAALAGRRIDALASKICRFPLQNAAQVKKDLNWLFSIENVDLLVCSAACGADLIGLDVSRQRGMRSRIILPFSVERFRQCSVVDRPGDWGPLFDEIIASTPTSDLIFLNSKAEADDAYAAVTQEIVRQAVLAAAPASALAIAVWEGHPRQETDATASFLRYAKQAGMEERVVSTC